MANERSSGLNGVRDQEITRVDALLEVVADLPYEKATAMLWAAAIEALAVGAGPETSDAEFTAAVENICAYARTKLLAIPRGGAHD